jgi:hypothetical protein
MAHSYLELSGLWKKSTRRGEVLSARLTAPIRQRILSALLDTDQMIVELVVMPASNTPTAKSPSHKLLLALEVPTPEPSGGEEA